MGACLATRSTNNDEPNTLNQELIDSEENSKNTSASIRETSGRDHIFMTERNELEQKEVQWTDDELEIDDEQSSSCCDMTKFKHYKKRMLLSDDTLVEWMQSKHEETEFILIDVRNPNMDYLGGHINGAINIQHVDFIQRIKGIIETYHAIPHIIFYCMYSQCRSPMCCDWYCMAVTALLTEFELNNAQNITGNKDKAQQSFMKICLHESKDFNDLYGIKMNEEIYHNLCQQNIYVLNLGFAHFVNKNRDNKDLVVDFDKNMWMKQPSANTLIHRNDW